MNETLKPVADLEEGSIADGKNSVRESESEVQQRRSNGQACGCAKNPSAHFLLPERRI